MSAAALATGLFALLARGVVGGATRAADESAVAWFRSLSHTAFDVLALVGAALGSSVALWITLGVGSVVL